MALKDEASRKEYRKLSLLLILFVSLIVYLNSIFGGFVLDDMVLIQKNPAIQSFWNIGLLTYRWLRTFSYAVDYSIWGLNPIGYHLSNLLYNTLVVLLVYFVTKRLTANRIISFVTSLLFALHPIHTEAVSYLSGRRDVLSALFYLLGFLAYLKGRESAKIRYFATAVLCYLLGVSAKEMAVTLPLMIFAYEVLQGVHKARASSDAVGRLFYRSLGKNLNRFRWLILFTALLVGAYLYIDLFLEHASGMVSSKGIQWWGGDPVSNFATVATVLAAYVKKLFFPVVLRFDYRRVHLFHSLLAPPVLLSGALILALLLLSFLMVRRHGIITFAIWFFFITLLPVMQIIPHHMLMAEHYLYLPSYGFCLVGGCLADYFYRTRRAVVPVLLSLLCLTGLYYIRTVVRNQDWTDTLTLTQEGLRHDPGNPVYHFFRGHAYHLAHLEQSAWQELERAVYPHLYRDSKVFAIRAVILFNRGDYEGGMRETRKALEIDPNDQMALVNGGYFALMMGDNEKALRYYLKVEPDYDKGGHLQNIAKIYVDGGHLDQAEQTMKKALSIHPERAELHYDMAEVLVKKLAFNRAEEEYREAVRLGGDDPGSSDFLKGVPEKIEWAKRLQGKVDALKISEREPSDPGKNVFLGRLYLDAGNYRKAEEMLHRACDKGDVSLETRRLLARALTRRGKRNEAVKVVRGFLAEKGPLPADFLETSAEVLSQGLDFKGALRLERQLARMHSDDQEYSNRILNLKKLNNLKKRSDRLFAAGDAVNAAITQGDLLARVGRGREAVASYESALKNRPDDLSLLKKLFDLYEALGYPFRKSAIETGNHLLQLDPTDSETILELWKIYYNRVKDYEAALSLLDHAVRADPSLAEESRIGRPLKILRRYVETYKKIGADRFLLHKD